MTQVDFIKYGKFSITLISLISMLTGYRAKAQNFIVNGDFESGISGIGIAPGRQQFCEVGDSSNIALLAANSHAPAVSDGRKRFYNNFLTAKGRAPIETKFSFGSSGNSFATDDIVLKLYVPCAVVPSATVQQPNCTTATANVSVTAPTGAEFQYSLNGATYQSSPNFPNLAPGNYSLTYKNTTLNCISPPNAITITASPGAPAAPTVTSPVYYCQNAAAAPLTATPLTGNSLRWYGTNATGGTASATAPTPSTTAVGDVTYYVSQYNGSCESARAAIIVRVSAPTGASVNLFCDGVNTTTTNVAFDWSNVNGYLGYNYSYSINGGPLVFGSQVSPSHFNVPVSGPGINVTFNILSVIGVPCTQPESATCHSTCPTVTPPGFAAIGPYCSGSPVPALATTSPNGITGTWSPSVINNTVSGSYVFTPNVNCSSPQTLTVTINPRITPTFNAINPVCQNATPPTLPTTSTNGITGTWSPAVTTSTPGTRTYTFTPTAGQCVTSTPVTLNISVDPTRTPNFATIPAFCSGTAAPILATTAPNGITGTWSPATVSNVANGVYTFTPNAGQCAVNQILNITVTPSRTPNFAPIADICSGSPAPALATTSPNGITGSWLPSTINNMANGTYTFTPNIPCAANQTLTVNIKARITPMFATIAPVCRNSTPPALPLTSLNTITGTWNPAVISTANAGTFVYVFTPISGQCVTPGTVNLFVTVLPILTPNFPMITSFCEGSVVTTTLDNISPNGVHGTWNPASINNMEDGDYTFTPNSDQCAVSQILHVDVIQKTVPTFNPIPAFCSGSAAPLLQSVSNNGIAGTWDPAVIDNLSSGIYRFTPNTGLCATNYLIHVVVLDPITPDFPDFEICKDVLAPSFATTSPNGISGTWLPSTVDTTVSGIFPFVFTPNAGECAVSETIQVTVNEPTLVSVASTVSNAFSDNPQITVNASFAGEYLYQLDNGPLQESPVFNEVSAGSHTVTVIDRNGCSAPITEENIVIIDYPKFFTPNGDGVNDTWNIIGLKETIGTKIFIFDRYGKLIKQISPDGKGWDGTYNGRELPSSDYWFNINYSEKVSKQYRNHFSLKR